MRVYIVVSKDEDNDQNPDSRIIQAVCTTMEMAEQMCKDLVAQYKPIQEELRQFIDDYNEKDSTPYTEGMSPKEADDLYGKALDYSIWIEWRQKPEIMEIDCDVYPKLPMTIKTIT